MKKTLTILFAVISFNVFAQSDSSSIIMLSDTFCFSNQKPLPFVPGTKVSTLCDTLFIINKHRYMLYEKAANIIRDKKYISTCSVLIENYEERIHAQNVAFSKLYNDYIALDSISQKTIIETKGALIQVNNTIASAQSNIVVVDKKMDDLTRTIKEQRKKSFFDKILYGIGGIAVGILGGLVIAQ